MNWYAWCLSLWPGLPRLWLRGDGAALLLAAGFTALLNLAILGTFVWPLWLGAGFQAIVWPVLGAVWAISLWSHWFQRETLFCRPVLPGQEPAAEDTASYDRLFIEAQGEYLKCQADRAIQLLERQLSRYPRDAESRLLLVSVLRRKGAADRAAQQLEWLSRLDQAAPWREEIRREAELLARDRRELEQSGETENSAGERNLQDDQDHRAVPSRRAA